MSSRSDQSSGFVLITVVLAMSLLCLIGGLLQLELALVGALVAEAETQMHSQVLASNGIELARSILSSSEPQELLLGGNGVPDCAGTPGWRDPLPLELAWQADPALVTTDCDDGLPTALGLTPAVPALATADGGWILIRFSNDPEEPPDEDHNDTVLVRSMGIVPAPIREASRFTGRNSVSVVEARLRRERAFSTGTALTLVGTGARLSLSSADSIRRDGGPPLDVVEYPDAGLVEDAVRAATDLGLTAEDWYRDISAGRLSDPAFRRFLEPAFWNGVDERLERLGPGGQTEPGRGLHLIPRGAVLEGEMQGLCVARGDVVLASNSSFRGLFVHLGGGSVRFDSGASLSGGLWMASFSCEGTELVGQEMRLEIASGARLVYDAEKIRGAVAYLPPTQLMWRIIFPEMDGE